MTLIVLKKEILVELGLCTYYKALNQITIKHCYTSLKIDELIVQLKGAQYYNKINLGLDDSKVCIDPMDVQNVVLKMKFSILSG